MKKWAYVFVKMRGFYNHWKLDQRVYVTASCYWSLDLLAEIEEPAEKGASLGTGAHSHRSILPPGVKYKPGPWVLRRKPSNRSFIPKRNRHLPDSPKSTA